MRPTPVVAALAVGGVAAVEFGADSAQASSQHQVSQADLDAANQRSQAAIRLAKDLQNNVGKYLQPAGQLIGAKAPPPPITQDRGTGDGLPSSTIKDGAITEAKLAAALADKLPRWIAKVDNSANTTSRASSPAYSVLRIAAGNYRADFGETNVSQCSWHAVPSTDMGLPAGFEVRTALDATDPTRVIVRTYTSAGALVESGWQAQVFC